MAKPTHKLLKIDKLNKQAAIFAAFSVDTTQKGFLLQMSAVKAQVDVLAIDHVEKPSAN